MITKKDITKLLDRFLEEELVEREESVEIKEHLFNLIDTDRFSNLDLETCFYEEHMICSLGVLWETLEDIWNND